MFQFNFYWPEENVSWLTKKDDPVIPSYFLKTIKEQSLMAVSALKMDK